MTLEEAQAEILRLNEELETAKNANENYSTQVNELNTELEKVRDLNQQYFLKLSARYNPNQQDDDEDEEFPTCEEFAQTLTI